FDNLVSVISQGKVRRGAFSPYLPIEHPDALEFIRIGEEGHPIQGLTHGVTVTNRFIERLYEGDKEARTRWAEVIKARGERGYPYILFIDKVDDNTVDVYKDQNRKIVASNLCVAPETKVLTSEGYWRIEDLKGKYVSVWNGNEFSMVKVVKTGEDQPLVKVITDSGPELECTPYHKFYVQEDYRSVPIIKQADELSSGDKLIKSTFPIIEGRATLQHAYENGFFSGDGCLHKGKSIVYLYGSKKKLESSMVLNGPRSENDTRISYTNVQGLQDKFFVPLDRYSIESRLQWLAGYLDADGTVARNGTNESLQVACVNLEFLKKVQLLL